MLVASAMLPKIGLLTLVTLGLSLPLWVMGPLRAAPDPQDFPPEETFRKLRLIALTCGRENTQESCDQARRKADPLLDHPRLPASCKDALWAIRQKAVTAPVNSFTRRDPIDDAANDLKTFCRQTPSKKDAETAKPAPPSGRSNFGFGPIPK